MTNITRPTGTACWFSVLSTAVLLAGLFLASAWDGDGNPATDNLPQATVTLASRTVRTADEKTEGDGGDIPPQQHRRTAHRPRLFRFALRELSWRRAAVPSRGPPEGGRDG